MNDKSIHHYNMLPQTQPHLNNHTESSQQQCEAKTNTSKYSVYTTSKKKLSQINVDLAELEMKFENFQNSLNMFMHSDTHSAQMPSQTDCRFSGNSQNHPNSKQRQLIFDLNDFEQQVILQRPKRQQQSILPQNQLQYFLSDSNQISQKNIIPKANYQNFEPIKKITQKQKSLQKQKSKHKSTSQNALKKKQQTLKTYAMRNFPMQYFDNVQLLFEIMNRKKNRIKYLHSTDGKFKKKNQQKNAKQQINITSSTNYKKLRLKSQQKQQQPTEKQLKKTIKSHFNFIQYTPNQYTYEENKQFIGHQKVNNSNQLNSNRKISKQTVIKKSPDSKTFSFKQKKQPSRNSFVPFQKSILQKQTQKSIKTQRNFYTRSGQVSERQNTSNPQRNTKQFILRKSPEKKLYSHQQNDQQKQIQMNANNEDWSCQNRKQIEKSPNKQKMNNYATPQYISRSMQSKTADNNKRKHYLLKSTSTNQVNFLTPEATLRNTKTQTQQFQQQNRYSEIMKAKEMNDMFVQKQSTQYEEKNQISQKFIEDEDKTQKLRLMKYKQNEDILKRLNENHPKRKRYCACCGEEKDQERGDSTSLLTQYKMQGKRLAKTPKKICFDEQTQEIAENEDLENYQKQLTIKKCQQCIKKQSNNQQINYVDNKIKNENQDSKKSNEQQINKSKKREIEQQENKSRQKSQKQLSSNQKQINSFSKSKQKPPLSKHHNFNSHKLLKTKSSTNVLSVKMSTSKHNLTADITQGHNNDPKDKKNDSKQKQVSKRSRVSSNNDKNTRKEANKKSRVRNQSQQQQKEIQKHQNNKLTNNKSANKKIKEQQGNIGGNEKKQIFTAPKIEKFISGDWSQKESTNKKSIKKLVRKGNNHQQMKEKSSHQEVKREESYHQQVKRGRDNKEVRGKQKQLIKEIDKLKRKDKETQQQRQNNSKRTSIDEYKNIDDQAVNIVRQGQSVIRQQQVNREQINIQEKLSERDHQYSQIGQIRGHHSYGRDECTSFDDQIYNKKATKDQNQNKFYQRLQDETEEKIVKLTEGYLKQLYQQVPIGLIKEGNANSSQIIYETKTQTQNNAQFNNQRLKSQTIHQRQHQKQDQYKKQVGQYQERHQIKELPLDKTNENNFNATDIILQSNNVLIKEGQLIEANNKETIIEQVKEQQWQLSIQKQRPKLSIQQQSQQPEQRQEQQQGQQQQQRQQYLQRQQVKQSQLQQEIQRQEQYQRYKQQEKYQDKPNHVVNDIVGDQDYVQTQSVNQEADASGLVQSGDPQKILQNEPNYQSTSSPITETQVKSTIAQVMNEQLGSMPNQTVYQPIQVYQPISANQPISVQHSGKSKSNKTIKIIESDFMDRENMKEIDIKNDNIDPKKNQNIQQQQRLQLIRLQSQQNSKPAGSSYSRNDNINKDTGSGLKSNDNDDESTGEYEKEDILSNNNHSNRVVLENQRQIQTYQGKHQQTNYNQGTQQLHNERQKSNQQHPLSEIQNHRQNSCQYQQQQQQQQQCQYQQQQQLQKQYHQPKSQYHQPKSQTQLQQLSASQLAQSEVIEQLQKYLSELYSPLMTTSSPTHSNSHQSHQITQSTYHHIPNQPIDNILNASQNISQNNPDIITNNLNPVKHHQSVSQNIHYANSNTTLSPRINEYDDLKTITNNTSDISTVDKIITQSATNQQELQKSISHLQSKLQNNMKLKQLSTNYDKEIYTQDNNQLGQSLQPQKQQQSTHQYSESDYQNIQTTIKENTPINPEDRNQQYPRTQSKIPEQQLYHRQSNGKQQEQPLQKKQQKKLQLQQEHQKQCSQCRRYIQLLNKQNTNNIKAENDNNTANDNTKGSCHCNHYQHGCQHYFPNPLYNAPHMIFNPYAHFNPYLYPQFPYPPSSVPNYHHPNHKEYEQESEEVKHNKRSRERRTKENNREDKNTKRRKRSNQNKKIKTKNTRDQFQQQQQYEQSGEQQMVDSVTNRVSYDWQEQQGQESNVKQRQQQGKTEREKRLKDQYEHPLRTGKSTRNSNSKSLGQQSKTHSSFVQQSSYLNAHSNSLYQLKQQAEIVNFITNQQSKPILRLKCQYQNYQTVYDNSLHYTQYSQQFQMTLQILSYIDPQSQYLQRLTNKQYHNRQTTISNQNQQINEILWLYPNQLQFQQSSTFQPILIQKISSKKQYKSQSLYKINSKYQQSLKLIKQDIIHDIYMAIKKLQQTQFNFCQSNMVKEYLQIITGAAVFNIKPSSFNKLKNLDKHQNIKGFTFSKNKKELYQIISSQQIASNNNNIQLSLPNNNNTQLIPIAKQRIITLKKCLLENPNNHTISNQIKQNKDSLFDKIQLVDEKKLKQQQTLINIRWQDFLNNFTNSLIGAFSLNYQLRSLHFINQNKQTQLKEKNQTIRKKNFVFIMSLKGSKQQKQQQKLNHKESDLNQDHKNPDRQHRQKQTNKQHCVINVNLFGRRNNLIETVTSQQSKPSKMQLSEQQSSIKGRILVYYEKNPNSYRYMGSGDLTFISMRVREGNYLVILQFSKRTLQVIDEGKVIINYGGKGIELREEKWTNDYASMMAGEDAEFIKTNQV